MSSAYPAVQCISIHALLAESDFDRDQQNGDRPDFYPRSPCGERPIFAVRPYDAPIFLSTLSLRRATSVKYMGDIDLTISIHALLAESDTVEKMIGKKERVFLSTLSLRRATPRLSRVVPTPIFLSTLSLRRATAKVHKTVGYFCAYETIFLEIASSC